MPGVKEIESLCPDDNQPEGEEHKLQAPSGHTMIEYPVFIHFHFKYLFS